MNFIKLNNIFSNFIYKILILNDFFFFISMNILFYCDLEKVKNVMFIFIIYITNNIFILISTIVLKMKKYNIESFKLIKIVLYQISKIIIFPIFIIVIYTFYDNFDALFLNILFFSLFLLSFLLLKYLKLKISEYEKLETSST